MSADLLQDAHEELVAMEIDIQSKQMKVAQCKATLKETASRLKALEVKQAKSILEDVKQLRKAAEIRCAEMSLDVKNGTTTVQDLHQRLAARHRMMDMLMEEKKASGEYRSLFLNAMDDAKDRRKVSLEKEALTSGVSDLTVEGDCGKLPEGVGCRVSAIPRHTWLQDVSGKTAH